MHNNIRGVAALLSTVLTLTIFSISNVGAQVETTRAVEQLMKAMLDPIQTGVGTAARSTLAKAIFNYCTETSNHLPRNSKAEDERLAKEDTAAAFGDMKRLEALVSTVEYLRSVIPKSLGECAQISNNIVRQKQASAVSEAVLWVRLEAAFDLGTAETVASKLGFLRLDENGNTISDLHGITQWPLVRSSIRNIAVLPLLLGRQ